jgi:hypothetical protein
MDRIQDELANIRHPLEKIRETKRAGRGIELVLATSETKAKVVPNE